MVVSSRLLYEIISAGRSHSKEGQLTMLQIRGLREEVGA